MKTKCLHSEAVVRMCSLKKVFLEISQNSQENACARVSFFYKVEACNFIKKETLAQVFFCEFCKISKKTFSYRTPPVAGCIWTLNFDTKAEENHILTENYFLVFAVVQSLKFVRNVLSSLTFRADAATRGVL